MKTSACPAQEGVAGPEEDAFLRDRNVQKCSNTYGKHETHEGKHETLFAHTQ